MRHGKEANSEIALRSSSFSFRSKLLAAAVCGGRASSSCLPVAQTRLVKLQ